MDGDEFGQPVVYDVPVRPVVVEAGQKSYTSEGEYVAALRRAAAQYDVDRSAPDEENK